MDIEHVPELDVDTHLHLVSTCSTRKNNTKEKQNQILKILEVKEIYIRFTKLNNQRN